jgi:hypothetical protein
MGEVVDEFGAAVGEVKSVSGVGVGLIGLVHADDVAATVGF